MKGIPTVRVGDVVRLTGGSAFADAIVTKVYEHATCGWRFDCTRPYALEVSYGTPLFGFEAVDFLDASRQDWQVVSTTPRVRE